MEIPSAWVLSGIGILLSTIAGMAGVMWGFMKARLEAQDKIIADQSVTIKKLQEDVDRMAKGCGMEPCLWKHH